MTPRDRALADLFAKHTVARILDAATNDEVVDRLVETWSGHAQRVVGRAVLRLAMYLCIGVVAIASYKLGLMDKLAEVFRK